MSVHQRFFSETIRNEEPIEIIPAQVPHAFRLASQSIRSRGCNSDKTRQAMADHPAGRPISWNRRAESGNHHRREQWGNLQHVREAYPQTDQVGSCLVFDVKGNAYRLIAGVRYASMTRGGTLFVKHFLTHAEYARDDWKKDCGHER